MNSLRASSGVRRAGNRRTAGAARCDVIGTAVRPLTCQACERIGRPLDHADIAGGQSKLDRTVPQHLMHASPPEVRRPGQVRDRRISVPTVGWRALERGSSRLFEFRMQTSSAMARFRAGSGRVRSQPLQSSAGFFVCPHFREAGLFASVQAADSARPRISAGPPLPSKVVPSAITVLPRLWPQAPQLLGFQALDCQPTIFSAGG
ncbi:hypothetical protein ABIA16_002197 [Sinorhizobium fredii]